MKKILTILTALFTALQISASALYGSWAAADIQTAYNGGILTDSQLTYDLSAPIPRNEIAMLAVKAYINIVGYDLENIDSHFTDTKSVYAEAAYRLGIIYGTSDTEFTPYAYTTRQEITKIILSLRAALNGNAAIPTGSPRADFTDFEMLADWAKPYVAKAASDGIINGFPDGSFGGEKSVSWEQAISLIVRSCELNDSAQLPTYDDPPAQILNMNSYIGTAAGVDTRISWNTGGTEEITVTEARNSYYTGDIAPLTRVYKAVEHIDIQLNPNRKYTVSVGGVTKTFNTAKVAAEGAESIRESYPEDKTAADAITVSVTVPVWRVAANGEKVPSTATFSVHSAIAEKVRLVFEEIYNGSERFPIRDIGGYAWRGGRTEHNGGTAIDINYNENYCIYNNGTVIGKYWKPYEDMYSITPYGDVVNAFERYGFTWGGDAWRNPRDYMHFSYLGT